jgi:hypothetical protein
MCRSSPLPIFYFTKVKNVGDQVNVDLIDGLFGRKAALSDQRARHLLAVGSLMGMANRHSQVWGTGVLHPSVAVPDIPPGHVHSVRGKLSYEVIRHSGVAIGDIPLGDPAFLVARIIPRRASAKTYRLGVAAHYADRFNPWLKRILQDPEVADLNVHADPREFLETLDACEAVVSSSLHGLVFAEALSVPNAWIKLSDLVLGDGFKFRDWFSVSDTPQQKPVLPDDHDTAASLAAQTRLHDMRIDATSLVDAFPFRN